MGHLRKIKEEYLALQRRHDQGPTGLPPADAIFDVLQMLYTPQEARIAANMPWKPITVDHLSKKLDQDTTSLETNLLTMAEKGLIFDLTDPKTGTTRFLLTPPVVGFIEFSMMRVHQGIDQQALAEKLHTYMFEDRNFIDRIFLGPDTVIGRALVNDEVVAEDITEILDYERAEVLIEQSGGGAVGLCYCRHKGEHVGNPCKHPTDICTSLYPAADYMIRQGMARPAEVAELKDILAQARERGLVQIADNVQQKPAYICHCCGCHCVQLRAISEFGLTQAVRTSSRIAAIDSMRCKGCGQCARRCPIGAISLINSSPKKGPTAKLRAKVDENICLGCMVCHRACTKNQAISFPARAERVLTPKNTLERIIMRALEMGSLHHLLFGSPETKTMAFWHRFLGVVENLPPVRKVLLNTQVKSRLITKMTQPRS